MNGYLLIADILGFSNIINNTSEQDLDNRILDWTNLIKELTLKYNFHKYQLLSDTLFLTTEGNNSSDLGNLISFSKKLLLQSLMKSLPIRGAITYGKFKWGEFIYGKAIIKGHALETKQNWIGITLENSLLHIENHWGNDSVVCYPTPLKSGDIKINPVIAWEIPSFKILVDKTIQKGLMNEGEVLNWQAGEKVRNTIEFKIYLNILRKTNNRGNNFISRLPIA